MMAGGVARQRAGLQRRLLEEAVGDFGDRAAADIGRARDRHQVGDERERRLAVAAGECREHALIFVAAGRGLQRELLDVLGEVDLAVEILDQPPPPDREKLQRVDQRIEQRDVAGADFDIASTPKAAVASSASASISASAAARSCRPKDSMPACRNSLGSPQR